MEKIKNVFKKVGLQNWLIIACAVLLLAVIVVSALAYTWHKELKEVAFRAKMLQISASSVDSLTSEIQELQMENGTLNAQLEAANATIAQLQAAAEDAGE